MPVRDGEFGMNTMPVSEIIEKATAICKKNGVKRLDLFGSFATGTATPTSDIDFVVYPFLGRKPHPTWSRVGMNAFLCTSIFSCGAHISVSASLRLVPVCISLMFLYLRLL